MVYGSQLKLFLLLVFLTLKIFTLEYITQRLDSNYINFASKKHQVTFKLKKEVVPFNMFTRATEGIVEKMLMDMDFQWGEDWNYDPYDIISNKRVQLGSTPYIH